MSANNEKLIDKFEMAWNYGRTLCYANSIMPPQNATNEKDKKKTNEFDEHQSSVQTHHFGLMLAVFK